MYLHRGFLLTGPEMSNFFYKHAIVSILLVIWMVALTSWVTYQVFADLKAITTQAAAAYGTLFGLPAIAIGLWKWRNSKDDKPTK